MSFFWRVGGGGGVIVCLGIYWGFVGNPGDFLGF